MNRKGTKHPFIVDINKLSTLTGKRLKASSEKLTQNILKSTFLSSEQKGALIVQIKQHQI